MNGDKEGILKGTETEARYLVKLVRNDVGLLLPDQTVSYEQIPAIKRIPLLRAKLVEEAVEYLLNPSVGEMVDIEEVCLALAQHDLCVSPTQIETQRQRKRRERGGFDRWIGMYTLTPEATHA